MLLDDFIITVYCFVDDFLKNYEKLRSRGPSPALSDAEVLTMEIVGEFLKIGSEKGIHDYFNRHWISWFPNLSSRVTFAKQAANLWFIKQQLQRHLASSMSKDKDLFIVDGFPVPTCHIKRYKRSKTDLSTHGAIGYCAAKDEKYFGFKGHIITTQEGLIIGFALSAANVDERDILPELVTNCRGDLIADKGLIRPSLSENMKKQGITLHTPLRSNMKDERPKQFIHQIMDIRRRIETVIGQLVDLFSIQKMRAKDLWHLTSKISRKILAHTFAFFIARSILFEKIIS